MKCPGSGRIPTGGGSLIQDGKVILGHYQIRCDVCDRMFPAPDVGMLLPKHEAAIEA